MFILCSKFFNKQWLLWRQCPEGMGGRAGLVRKELDSENSFCCGGEGTRGSASSFKNSMIRTIERSQVGTHKGTQWGTEGRGEKCTSGTWMCHIKQSETEPCVYTVRPYKSEFNCPFHHPHRHTQTCAMLISGVFLNAVKLTSVCMYMLVYVLTCFGCVHHKYAGGG